MYSLYTLTDEGININWFDTESKCLDYVKRSDAIRYKIYKNDRKIIDYHFALEWDDVKKDFITNMAIAKEIKKNSFREKRDFYFDKLDKYLFKAIEFEDIEKQNIAKDLKQQLRDITNIELPDEEIALYYFIPQIFTTIENLVI